MYCSLACLDDQLDSQIPSVHVLFGGGGGRCLKFILSLSLYILFSGGLGCSALCLKFLLYMYSSLVGLDDQLGVSNSLCTFTVLWQAG